MDNFPKAAMIGPDRWLFSRWISRIWGRWRIQSGMGPETLVEMRVRNLREEGSLAGKGVDRKFPDRSRKIRVVM